MARTRASSRPLTDHEEIRRWAEDRDAAPACVRGTGGAGDLGMIRLDFPGYTGADKLEEISWDEWFEKFDERNLALLVQDETARGQKSNFNKLVNRETASAPRRRVSRAQSAGAGVEETRSERPGRARTAKRGRRAAARSGARATGRGARGRRGATAARGRRRTRTSGGRRNQRTGSARLRTIARRSRSSRTRAGSSRKRAA
jgi:hypothetical protein